MLQLKILPITIGLCLSITFMPGAYAQNVPCNDMLGVINRLEPSGPRQQMLVDNITTLCRNPTSESVKTAQHLFQSWKQEFSNPNVGNERGGYAYSANPRYPSSYPTVSPVFGGGSHNSVPYQGYGSTGYGGFPLQGNSSIWPSTYPGNFYPGYPPR